LQYNLQDLAQILEHYLRSTSKLSLRFQEMVCLALLINQNYRKVSTTISPYMLVVLLR